VDSLSDVPRRDNPGTRTERADHPASAWSQHSAALSAWFYKHFVNRHDCFGRYIAVERRTDPDLTACTDKDGLTLAVLQKHFQGASTGDLVGLHSTLYTEAGCTSRWLGLDFDRHDEKTDPEVIWKFAHGRYELLKALGFQPLLFDSNGKGGCHLVVLFDAPTPTERVFRFGKWLVKGWKESGLDDEPETFPKQPAIGPDGFGNWLRLPGRHHTRDHYTRVWDGVTWLDGLSAIKAILKTTGMPASKIPAEALKAEKPKAAKRTKPPRNLCEDAELAREALQFVGHMASDYRQWLEVGMALTPLGNDGLALWDDWSREDPEKYREGACERKWRSFRRNGTGGIALGTLFHHAKANGWKPPARPSIDRNGKHEPTGAGKPGAGGKAAQGEDKRDADGGPDQDAVFANFYEREISVGPEKTMTVQVALRAAELDRDLGAIAPGWPKRVGEDLFVPDSDHKPTYLDSPPRLFAWIDGRAQTAWTKGVKFITQERYHEHLRMSAEQYEAIETVPHFPPLPRVYYMHPPVGRGDGKRLNEFLDFFSPDTGADRELIRAMLITPFWGGGCGQRPAFLVTGPDRDSGQGRGVGKTTLADVISAEILGGFVAVSADDEMDRVKTRLLSDTGLQARIGRLGNVKMFKMSWSDLEDLITAPVISGHRMYKGEGRRPNFLVWFVTLNGASLSKDMAQRAIPVKLKRPAFDPGWEARVRSFAREHRWEIIADVRARLEDDRGLVTPVTRWAAWERDVLAQTDKLKECQDLIILRQETIDEDNSDRCLVADHFARKLRELGEVPETACVLIPSQWAAEWLSEVTRKKYATNTASAFIGRLGIDQLTNSRTEGVRGWIWRGSQATCDLKPKDLTVRV
jgi:hypothetical protein